MIGFCIRIAEVGHSVFFLDHPVYFNHAVGKPRVRVYMYSGGVLFVTFYNNFYWAFFHQSGVRRLEDKRQDWNTKERKKDAAMLALFLFITHDHYHFTNHS